MKRKKIKSESSHAILDFESREKKAGKIVSVLNVWAKDKPKKVLDIGTGSGHIASFLAEHYQDVISVDVVDERKIKKGYHFVQVKSEELPFDTGAFDAVVTNHVIEHVPEQKTHMNELHRVLKKNGLAYLATPNKYWLYDPHYKLPLISWLPRKSGSKYLKVTQGKKWDIYPVSNGTIKKFAKAAGFKNIKNVTPEIIKYPEKFNLDTYWLIKPVMKLLPLWTLRLLNPITPTLIFVLEK